MKFHSPSEIPSRSPRLAAAALTLLAVPAALLAQAPSSKPIPAPTAATSVATSPAPKPSAAPRSTVPSAAAKPVAPIKPPALGSLAVPSLAAADFQRIDLPGGTADKPFPYTIEIPKGWSAHEKKGAAVLVLGPDGAEPEKDPRVVVVRISPAALDKPDETAANIRKADTEDPSWSAPLVEVREVGGARGVVIEMRSGGGEVERGTLVLKMPLPKTSVDFMGTAGMADFPKLRPFFERVLFSVRAKK